jgi:hypothetical protein
VHWLAGFKLDPYEVISETGPDTAAIVMLLESEWRTSQIRLDIGGNTSRMTICGAHFRFQTPTKAQKPVQVT